MWIRQRYASSGSVWSNWTHIGEGSNPNLLINWDFTNPVNQRGQTTYTASGTYSYTIDRWRIRGQTRITVLGNNGGIKYGNNPSSTGYAILEQIIDNMSDIEGKALTMSIIIDGQLVTMTIDGGWTFPADSHINLKFIYHKRMSVSIQAYANKQIGVYIYIGASVAANTNYTLSKIKLELGEVSTLLNDPPQNPNEELIKCLPYGELIGKGTWCKAYGNGSVHICVPFRVYKRAKPTINLLTTTLAFYGMTANTNVTLTGVTSRGNGADQYGLGFMYIEGTADTNFVKGAMYGLQNNYVFADAEIYP